MPKEIPVPARAFELFIEMARDPAVLEMRRFRQHRSTSTYDHSVAVAKAACWIAWKRNYGPERTARIVKAALLHDFYLYEYHGARLKQGGLHAWRHPERALENAMGRYELDPVIQNAIRCHMFPGTLFHMPTHGEGWCVNAADKLCTLFELLGRPGFRTARLVPA